MYQAHLRAVSVSAIADTGDYVVQQPALGHSDYMICINHYTSVTSHTRRAGLPKSAALAKTR